MEKEAKKVTLKDVNALYNILPLIKRFYEKNPIRRGSNKLIKLEKKIKALQQRIKSRQEKAIPKKDFNNLLKKCKRILEKENFPPIYFMIGAHGGVIIKDIPFCEFDSPKYAMKSLFEKMRSAINNHIPYNLEVAICCLKWIKSKYPSMIDTFLDLFQQGKFEIINSTYSQPYSLMIGEESNIKQFQYGKEVLDQLGLSAEMYYCTESSLHPQIPQILRGFGIKAASLRTRLLGVTPTSPSGHVIWKGLDNSKITSLSDQSGLYNGEYFHGTFFQEIPNLLFQAVSRPLMPYIMYSSIEDFVMPLLYQKDIWRLNKDIDIFGKFFLSTEIFDELENSGEFKYSRDEFLLHDKLFDLSELILENKEAEISLITAEILNSLGSLYEIAGKDNFFRELWDDLLLAQAHDAYAVPYIKTGDYSRFQLSDDEFKKLDLRESEIPASELCIQICQNIQIHCKKFILNTLELLAEKNKKDGDKKGGQKILIFNPSPYERKDIIKLKLPTDNFFETIMTKGRNEVPYTKTNSYLKFIVNMPAFGLKVLKAIDEKVQTAKFQENYLYNVNISKDQRKIQVIYEDKNIFNIKFKPETLIKINFHEEIKNQVEKIYYINGLNQEEENNFSMEIKQYNGINRIEFILENYNLDKLQIEPGINVEKSFVNYPFGIEETKRPKIKALDFLLLKGQKEGLIIMHKNSPLFEINHHTYSINNLVRKGKHFEFAISFLKDVNFKRARKLVNLYYYRCIGLFNEGEIKPFNNEGVLSIKNPSSFVNLWRRNEKNYLRLLNPSQTMHEIELGGRLVMNNLEVLDFNFNMVNQLKCHKIKFKAWEIKTIRIINSQNNQ